LQDYCKLWCRFSKSLNPGRQKSLVVLRVVARSPSLESLKKKAYKFADRGKANGEKD